MIFYLFLSILILSAISIHLRIVLGMKTSFDKMMFYFLLAVTAHIILAITVKSTPKEFNYIAAPCGLLYGPILYFGFSGLNDRKIKKSQYLIHTIPFLVILSFYAVLLVKTELRIAFRHYFYAALYGTLILSWLCYPLWVIFQKPKEQESYEQNSLLLSVAFILMSQSIYLLLLIRFVIDIKWKLENNSPIYYVFTCLLASVILAYFFLANQLRQKRTFSVSERKANVFSLPSEENIERNSTFSASESKANKSTLPGGEDDESNSRIFSSKKAVEPSAHIPYQKSKIEAEAADRYRALIDEYMQKKPYLKPRFSLEEISGELKIYKHHCSQIFNKEYGMNFSQYINSKRVEHACSLLEQKDLDITMEEIAENCGFNSKASFYRNFTNIKDCTPKQYRRAFMA